MANVDNPHGFSPAGQIMRVTQYVKGTNAAIYPGDMCKLKADGSVVVATAASIELIGVAQGYQAATDTVVLVADDPDQLYYVQCDGTHAQTQIGLNGDLVATAGNATYLKSQQEINSTQTTSAGQLRVLGTHPSDLVSTNARVLVAVNEHAWAKKTAGL